MTVFLSIVQILMEQVARHWPHDAPLETVTDQDERFVFGELNAVSEVQPSQEDFHFSRFAVNS
jgi:hypothetical protein